MTVNLPSGDVSAELTAARVFEKGTHHVLGPADIARRRRADLDEVLPDRVLVVHRVEGDHALHVGRRELEDRRHFGHRRVAHPAALFLHDPKAGRSAAILVGIMRSAAHRARRVGRQRRPARMLDGRGAHRSISPMTISMLALMAITSDSRWPSTILGIAERLTNDGGRMRQRTGLAVPSETM